MPKLPSHFFWRSYQGQRYLLADYSYISEDVLAGTLYLTELNAPDTLLLVNIEGTPATKRFMALFLQASKDCEPYFLKAATIGVNKPKIIFIKLIKNIRNFDLHPFLTQELALKWLFAE
jgi:hypothetical protein